MKTEVEIIAEKHPPQNGEQIRFIAFYRDRNGVEFFGPYGATCYFTIKKKIGLELGGNPIDWNDHPDRTFEDIKRLVEKLDI